MDLSKLDGLISEETGEVLRRLAATIDGDHAIVEIGSYKGKSTCYLATGSKDGDGAQVFAVDPWDSEGNETGRFGFADPKTYKDFEDQLRKAKIKSYVTPVKGFSLDVAEDWREDGPDIGLLYIDGDHSKEAVTKDFYAWAPYLVPGHSLVLFDDYTEENPGVVEAIDGELVKHFSHSKVEAPGLFRAVFIGIEETNGNDSADNA